MATRVEAFTVTVPAGTPQSAPTLIPTPFDQGVVDRVEVVVPPGPSGLVGFQFAFSGVVVIPHEADQFIITDDDVIRWDLADYPTGAAWGIRAYNIDVYDHNLYVRYLITETGARAPAVIAPLDITQPDQGAPSDEDQPADVPPVDLTTADAGGDGYTP